MIVEDEFLPRAMLSDHLQECGFMVLEAANADEAIRTIETGIPINLVLTDIRMPGSMNGFGLANGSVPTNRKSVSFSLQERPCRRRRRTSFAITSFFSESHMI
jgi:DNA-binding response OmpR family regulator